MATLSVVSGKSGVGKDTIIRWLVNKYGFIKYPSLTTRPPRPTELEGVDYFFVNERHFKNYQEAGDLLDCVCISGYYYGFPIIGLMNAMANGKNFVVNMIAESGLALKRLIPQTKLFYLSFPSQKVQVERLLSRGMTKYEIGIRLRDDPNGNHKPSYYDYELVNYSSEQSAKKIAEIIGGYNEKAEYRMVSQVGAMG